MLNKKIAEMLKWKEAFLHGREAFTNDRGKFEPAIKGCVDNGVSEEVANKIWADMEDFASYAFNKSHAAAYSLITYQTAYLKCYYEPEFITSLFNNRISKSDKIKHYLAYAKEENLQVLPPDINKSQTYFSTDGKTIRFGLAALKNVGVGIIESIIEERNNNGNYKDLADFIWRVDSQALNKKCIEALIKSGAFDCFNRPRSQLMAVYSIMVDRATERKKKSVNGQMDLFGDIIEDTKLIEENEYPNIKEYVSNVKLQYEKEIAGTYLSGHPLDAYLDVIKNFTFNSSLIPSEDAGDEGEDDVPQNLANNEFEENDDELYGGLKNGDSVTCGGVINEIKVLTTKNGSRMAFLTVEDLTGSYDAVLFSKTYEKFKDMLAKDILVAIKGKFTVRDDRRPSISVDNLEILQRKENEEDLNKEEEIEIKKPRKLWLKYNINDGILHQAVLKILSEYNGIDEVYVLDTGSNKGYKTNNLITIKESLIYELETILNKDCIKIVE